MKCLKLLLLLTAACCATVLSSCSDSCCLDFDVDLGCQEICTIRFKIVDRSGNPVANVCQGHIKGPLELVTGTGKNISVIANGGWVNVNQNGQTNDIQMSQCIDSSDARSGVKPSASTMVGGGLLVKDVTKCPNVGQCVIWTYNATTQMNVSLDITTCTMIVTIIADPLQNPTTGDWICGFCPC